MAPKNDDIEHIEFIKEVKFRAFYDINYSYIQTKYKKIRKIISLETQIKILNMKIFLYNLYIKIFKFCYQVKI